MPISYVKVNWLNQPSTETPISQNNLRHMDDQIYLLTTEKAELTDLPTKVSDLTNDSGFQTASDIASAISAIGNIQIIKGRVDTYGDLPSSGQSVGDTYFVGLTTDTDMEEYVWTADEAWEKLGKVTAVDLEDYYTKGQVDTLLGSKVASAEIKAIKTVSGGIAYTLNGTDWVNVVSGDDGATFIPAVTSLGDLSWTNNKGYPNPSTVNVRGKDLVIKAIYPTLNDLQTIHPVGSIGDVYAVGNSTYNELYIWNVETSAWANIGSMQNPYVHPNHSGDVVSVGDGATTIGNNKVTNAKLAQVANNTIKGRKSSGTGNVEDLTPADVRTMLNVADGANNYVLPAATTSTIGGVKIKNYLTSTDVDAALTAAQGKVLKDLIDDLDDAKANKPTITIDSADTTPEVTLADNNEYIFSNAAITDLDITLPSGLAAGFIASVVVKIPASAFTISLVNSGSYNIATKGDGTWSTLDLTPTASKVVTIIFNYDGINMNVYVSEV